MKSMKRRLTLLCIVAMFATMLLSSCQKEEALMVQEGASVTINELGANNSKIAYTGHELHLDADIQAPGKIAGIKLQITLAETNYGWDFLKTYGDYKGLKEANFHEHVAVPENARPGMYNLLIVVTDERGQKTLSKSNFEVVKDLSLPIIEDATFAFKAPALIQVSGQLRAINKIAKVEVEVQSSVWTKNFIYTNSEMLGQTSFSWNEDIDISAAPAGHYHVNIKLSDQKEKHVTYSYHFDKD